MSSIVTEPAVESRTKSFTIADLAALPDDLPSGTVYYELDNGRLLAKAPPSDLHCAIQTNIGVALHLQGAERGFGKACVATGVVLRRNPDRLVGADVAFFATRSLPIRLSAEGYTETSPDLAVEVREERDSLAYTHRKVADYLKAGVAIVWVADPESQTVIEHRRDRESRVFSQADILTFDDLIPGFSLPVADALQD